MILNQISTRVVICTIILLLSPTTHAKDLSKADSLLTVLDREVKQAPIYNGRQTTLLDSLRHTIETTYDETQRFLLLDSLFRQCSPFDMNMALRVASRMKALSRHQGSDALRWRADLAMADAELGVGNNLKALQILDSLPQGAREKFRQDVERSYLTTYHTLYDEVGVIGPENPYYRPLLDRLSSNNPAPTDPTKRALRTIETLRITGQTLQARLACDSFVTVHPQIMKRNLVKMVMALAYLDDGDTLRSKELLAEVAINDVRRSVRRNTALTHLSEILAKEGDVDRAYSYIMTAFGDVSSSRSRNRMTRIVDMMPLVVGAYDARQQEMMQMQTRYNVVVTLLIIAIIAGVIVLIFKNKKLHGHQHELRSNNAELLQVKDSVSDLNRELKRQSHAKDVHLGELVRLCSEYIDIMSREHNIMMKALKNRQSLEEALRKIESEDLVTAFFDRFDNLILSVFPDYINKVNQLLRPEYRFDASQRQLTPELRIIALLRLGITNSQNIASILRYSLQTVYNYRTRLKMHLIEPLSLDKEALDSAIKAI